jgi:hypothetical protein
VSVAVTSILHPRVQFFHGEPSHLIHRLAHGGQLGMLGKLNVIERDDGEVFGDADRCSARGFQCADSLHIARDESRRDGLRAEVVGDEA